MQVSVRFHEEWCHRTDCEGSSKIIFNTIFTLPATQQCIFEHQKRHTYLSLIDLVGIYRSIIWSDLSFRQLDHVVNSNTSNLKQFAKVALHRVLTWHVVPNCWRKAENERVKQTLPNIVCLPWSSCVGPRVKKNWLELSSLPAFAIATRPRRTKRKRECISSYKTVTLPNSILNITGGGLQQSV